MKKPVLLLLVITISLIGCSKSNDDTPTNDDDYFEVVYLSEKYVDNSWYVGGVEFELDGCNTTKDLIGVSLGQFEKSNFFIDVHFAHYENLTDFENSTNESSNIRANSYVISDCFDNLDLTINFVLDNQALVLDESQNSFNKINKINKVSETNLQTTYSVHGEYKGFFKSSDNSITASLVGSYRAPLNVLK